MSRSKAARTRRIRRQTNAALRHGPSAKPTHKLRTGRTGKVLTKRLQSAKRGKGKAAGGWS